MNEKNYLLYVLTFNLNPLLFKGYMFIENYRRKDNEPEGQYQNENYLRDVKIYYDSITSFFKNKQPELDFTSFFEQVSYHKSSWDLFNKMFCDSIPAQNLSPLIFNAYNGFKGEHRGKVIKQYLIDFPDSIVDLENTIAQKQDLVLWNIYVKLFNNNIEDKEYKLRVLDNIKPFEEKLAKNLLKCYLKIIPMDKNGFQLLNDKFKPYINHFHQLRHLFESSLVNFPQSIQDEYFNKKNKEPLFDLRENLNFFIDMKHEIFYDTFSDIKNDYQIHAFIDSYLAAFTSYTEDTLTNVKINCPKSITQTKCTILSVSIPDYQLYPVIKEFIHDKLNQTAEILTYCKNQPDALNMSSGDIKTLFNRVKNYNAIKDKISIDGTYKNRVKI